MPLNDISDRKTPSDPSEIAFDAETGLPSDNQEILIFGHAASGTPASSLYAVKSVNNSGDDDLARQELEPIYGVGCELVKMVQAAIKAASRRGNFNQIKVIALASTDANFGTADVGLTNARNVKAEFIVVPYDNQDSSLRGKLKDHCVLVSGTERPDNLQYGSEGVMSSFTTVDPSTLVAPDAPNLVLPVLRDSSVNPYSLGELASACAGEIAGNAYPFNPLDNVTVLDVPAPVKQSDWISVGANLESEVYLGKGYTPLRVKANGDVAFVRTVTTRITNGISVAPVTAYYDLQDWQVIYFWRKTIWTRFNQVDFKNVKASESKARDAKGEMIRLAKVFEEDGAFQAVDKLAPQFAVQRSSSDRHRFDVLTPINVVPGLHVIATRVLATTQFDAFTV